MPALLAATSHGKEKNAKSSIQQAVHCSFCLCSYITYQHKLADMIMLTRPRLGRSTIQCRPYPRLLCSAHHVMPDIVHSDILDMGIYHVTPTQHICAAHQNSLISSAACCSCSISAVQKTAQSLSSEPHQPEAHQQACELPAPSPDQAECVGWLMWLSAWTSEGLHRPKIELVSTFLKWAR